MLSNKEFVVGTNEATLTQGDQFSGDDVKAYYCRCCGFIELFRIENKQIPKVTTERELWNYSDTQD